MSEMMCLRVIEAEDKGSEIIRLVEEMSNGKFDPNIYFVSPESLKLVEGAPFAYWVGNSVRNIFKAMPPFKDGSGRNACMTNPAGDDKRYFRLWWEVPSSSVGREIRWVPLAKGGVFSPFYSDVYLLVDWDASRETYRGFLGTFHRPLSKPASLECFFRPALTWPRRTTSGLAFRVLPEGSIFADKGPVAVLPDDSTTGLLALLALLNSSCFEGLVALQIAAADAAARSYEVGLIQRTPVPPFNESQSTTLANLSRRAWAEKRVLDSAVSTSHAFVSLTLRGALSASLASYANAWGASIQASETAVAAIRAEIDDFTFRLYGIGNSDRTALTVQFSAQTTSEDQDDPEAESEDIIAADAPAIAAEVLEYTIGCTFGRWDIRFATGEKPAPELPDPFAPLPVCPPGMLQNEQGLPAAPSDVPDGYPLRISWPGVLVDDRGHVEDIERRVREALQVIWPDRADAIEQEACEILGVRSLRDHFRKPAGFFADHLKRYSKSRRQAPIYLPLSTRSGEYTLWIYYHRLNDQMLYSCVNDFIEPKLRDEITPLVNQLRAKGANRSREEEKEFEFLQDFEQELQAFRDELLRLARLPWRPDLNDGVQINAAPLWPLFRLPKWQKTLKETWQSLEKGDYDWAHLAMTVWPQRVTPKCAKDRSLAIAHGVEDLFWVEDVGGWRALNSPKQEIEERKRHRQSAARERVKQLLAEFAASDESGLSADDVGRRLAAGEFDDRELTLLLYPQRMAEAVWESPTLSQRLGLKLPAKKTKSARDKFIKEIAANGCAEVAPMLEAALDGRAKSFAEVWREIERGERDDLALALALWPDRVVDRCAEDVALAEQHGLRKFFWVQHPAANWRRREAQEIEIANEVARRRGAAAGQGV